MKLLMRKMICLTLMIIIAAGISSISAFDESDTP